MIQETSIHKGVATALSLMFMIIDLETKVGLIHSMTLFSLI